MATTIKGIVKRFQAGITFQLSKRNSPLLIGFYKYLYKPKPGTLAAFLHAFSRAHTNLTAVQIGANDGFQNDPIHKFIKRDKWRAILLEPQPYLFKQFLEPLHIKSPSVTPVHAAFSYADGTLSLFKVACNERWATGLSSFDRSIIERHIESGHIEQKARKYGSTLPTDQSDWITSVEVPTLSPATLCRRYNILQVDLLQIDVEGLDDSILYLWDLEQRPVQALIFEHIHLSPERLTAVHIYLERLGYVWKTYGANTLVLHQDVREWHHFTA